MFFMFTNTNAKFRVNHILFIIRSRNLFFMPKLKFKYLINDIPINFCNFGNFVSMKNIRKKCNPSVLPNFVLYN